MVAATVDALHITFRLSFRAYMQLGGLIHEWILFDQLHVRRATTGAIIRARADHCASHRAGVIGGVLATVGDALQADGAIVQLNRDVSADFQSQVDDFKSTQEKDKMREEIDDLKEQVKPLEKIIKSNQN